MNDSDEHVRLTLQPIIDLFTCSDGGVAFTVLRHDVLPRAMEDPQYEMQVEAFETVSEVCKNILRVTKNGSL